MNLNKDIIKCENIFKTLSKNKKYKVVFFGVSSTFTLALNALKNVNITPDFICDNDEKKQNTNLSKYKIYNPKTLFSKDANFIVIVTCHYFNEIKKELSVNPKVKHCFYYLDFTSLFLTNKITLDNDKTLSLCPTLKDSIFNIQIINNNLNKKKHPFLIRKEEKSINFLSYTSYANNIILNKKKHEIIIDTSKYYFNEVVYRRLLEYHLFKLYETNRLKKPIIINNWDKLKNSNLLSTTLDTIKNLSSEKMNRIKNTQKIKKKNKNALILHLYYIDMIDTIHNELLNIPISLDIYISINPTCTMKDITKILKYYPHANIFIFENRGRDILPFIKILKKVYHLQYTTITKIHTKKTPQQKKGTQVGNYLRESLSIDFTNMISILEKEKKCGIIVPKNHKVHYLSDKNTYLRNKEKVKFISKILVIKYKKDFFYPSGSMFCFQPKVLKQLISKNIDSDYFLLETGCIDGNLEHGFERFFGLLAKINGYKVREI